MELNSILVNHYLSYAKSVIIDRALVNIDGLKPVQRRILVTMLDLGLLDSDFKKSQKIVGATMGLHPHGDSSIYEAMQLLTSQYDGINMPYLTGKGSFGKKYSRDMRCAHPRYTNAKLAPICREMFEGLKEDAVDIVDNFDGSEKEPVLLPVKFPNILVNASSGVAVGTSSEIPSFSLTKVCKAVQGILNETIKTPSDLADVLVAPEFTTGGFVHANRDSMVKLCATGIGSFVISGKVEVYSNKIVINEIPYTTTAEDISDAIEEAVKDKKIKGISEVNNEIGKDGFRLVVQIKKGYDSREILRDLCILTPLRTSITYKTRVIIDNRCHELGLLELLQKWIEFRVKTVQRVYNFRLKREGAEENLLCAWEKVVNDIEAVAQMISSNTEATAKELLMSKYKLTDIQADYLLDQKIKSLTKDNANKKIQRLMKVRELIKEYNYALEHVKEIIDKEQEEIIKKYGKPDRTTRVDELTEEDKKRREIKISEDLTTVVLTKGGFVRRIMSVNGALNKFVSKTGDEEVLRWLIKNNEHILVFDRFGVVHKILVDNIDASNKAQMTDALYKLAGLEKPEDMIYADACGDYTGYFNLIYPNGRGRRVFYDKAQGNRAKYKAGYEQVAPGRYWITKEDKFFMITLKKKAAYCDLSRLNQISNREAFKVARTASKDPFMTLMSYKELPNPSMIDLAKYSKGYTVMIGDDYFWVDEESNELAKQAISEHLSKYNKTEEENGDDTNNTNENESAEAENEDTVAVEGSNTES